jgi:hypothetical protein
MVTPSLKARLRVERRHLLVVGVATTAIALAVTVPGLPGWLRWGLVVLALVVTVASRLWKLAAWPDVVVASLIVIALIALGAQFFAEPEDTQSDPVAVVLPKAKVTILAAPEPGEPGESGDSGERSEPAEPAVAVEAGADVIVIVVEPTKSADDVPITYAPTRHKGKAREELREGQASADVVLEVERGEADAGASALLADVVGATSIYVMPASG